MAIEHPARRELAELVAHHFLGHQHRDVLLAVVDTEVKSDKLRQDGRAAAPDPDHLVTTGCARGFRLAQQISVDERALPTCTRHSSLSLLLLLLAIMPARNDEALRTLVLAGLLAFGREAPRRDPVLATLGAAAMR